MWAGVKRTLSLNALIERNTIYNIIDKRLISSFSGSKHEHALCVYIVENIITIKVLRTKIPAFSTTLTDDNICSNKYAFFL